MTGCTPDFGPLVTLDGHITIGMAALRVVHVDDDAHLDQCYNVVRKIGDTSC